jgi:hypothetical protein
MRGASLKPAEMYGLADNIRVVVALLPLMRVFRRYGQMTL